MSRQHCQWLSLRTRFMLWQLAVLSPVLLAILAHHFFLMPKITDPLEEIVHEISGEVLRVKSLQLSLHLSAMPVNDYLIHGNQREIETFTAQRQQVEKEFSATRATPFAEEHERKLVETAWQEWRQAEQLANQLLETVDPVGKPGVGEKMEQFDRHIDAASANLEELYRLAYQEIKQAEADARVARSDSLRVSTIAFLLAVTLSLVLGTALSHSILFNLKSLRMGAKQIAAGEWGQKVHAHGVHELEELADAFNAMAAKLQAHDVALQSLATHDALTGLENRRSLDIRLDEELRRGERYGHPVGLLMLDIDHFKHVNDTYGHVAGDAVLHQLATIVRNVVRPMDRVFRYGGEEFVVLMPETDGDGCLSLAERIREVVATTPFCITPREEIGITISIGVAIYPVSADTKESLIMASDAALYEAKRTGRNRVCTHARPTQDQIAVV